MAGRKLGRGLDSLIGRSVPPREAEEPGDDAGHDAGDAAILELDPKSIAPNPEQPRKEFEPSELKMLKSSIAQEGVLQPVLVRKVGDSYELVAGERRLRAIQELGLPSIPAIVMPATDDRMLELALVENIQRENLNPIEVGQAYRRLMDTKSLTQDALAKALGVSRSSVGNMVRLLELPADMQEAVAKQRITLGHAKVLLSMAESEEQRHLFERVAEERMSVRDLETERESTERQAAAQGKERRTRAKKKKPAQLVSLEEQFSERLGTKVTIHEGRGKGRIQIEFYSREDFEHIRSILLDEARTA